MVCLVVFECCFVFCVFWLWWCLVGNVGVCVGFYCWEGYGIDGVWVVVYVRVDGVGVFCGSCVVVYVCFVGVYYEWWVYGCVEFWFVYGVSWEVEWVVGYDRIFVVGGYWDVLICICVLLSGEFMELFMLVWSLMC